MKRVLTFVIIVAGLLLLLAAGIYLITYGISTEQTSDEYIQYIHDILATGDVGMNEYSSILPGQSTVLPREYPGAPPFIPHSPAGLIITKDTHPCLVCHITGTSFGPDHTATKIPESHYTDIPTGIISENIQGLRYNCLLCHLPQSLGNPN